MSAAIIGRWWNGGQEIVKMDNGELYALDGWNGERWLHCWQCADRYEYIGDEEYEIRPVYRFQAEKIDLDALEEGGPEEERALEVVDYELC